MEFVLSFSNSYEDNRASRNYSVSVLHLRQPMYISPRGVLIRNGATAVVNGAITLMLLLIAPLGLAAVIINTFAVTVSTFAVCMAADFVVAWLIRPSSPDSLSGGHRFGINKRTREEIDRRQRW